MRVSVLWFDLVLIVYLIVVVVMVIRMVVYYGIFGMWG